jgi:hypothetical protein
LPSEAVAIVIDKAANITSEVVVNVLDKSIQRWEPKPGVQANYLLEDYELADLNARPMLLGDGFTRKGPGLWSRSVGARLFREARRDVTEHGPTQKRTESTSPLADTTAAGLLSRLIQFA